MTKEEEQTTTPAIRRYLKAYFSHRPNPHILSAQVNSAITAYGEQEARSREERDFKGGHPDDDGFITVVRKSSKHARIEQEDELAFEDRANELLLDDNSDDDDDDKRALSRRKHMATKKQKFAVEEDKALSGFYRFQHREQRQKDTTDLRTRFEADRVRIAALKANRLLAPTTNQ